MFNNNSQYLLLFSLVDNVTPTHLYLSKSFKYSIFNFLLLLRGTILILFYTELIRLIVYNSRTSFFFYNSYKLYEVNSGHIDL